MESEINKYLGALADKDFVFYIIGEILRAFERVSEEDLLTCDLFWWMSHALGGGCGPSIIIFVLRLLEVNHKIVSPSQAYSILASLLICT